MSNAFPPAIALVPGFFGFDHRGETTYFADRFVAGLRSALEARGIANIPVLSVSTLGIGSLCKRQEDLLRELRALETPGPNGPRLAGPRTWHLVGHSTGGVDAAMLLRQAPLAERKAGVEYAARGWGEWTDLVERVGSVTTIAAPHFGTGLAESPIARFVAGHPSPAAARDMVSAALSIAHRGDLTSRIRFALSSTPGLSKMPFFLLQMLLMNELARDLRPEVLAPLSAQPLRAAAADRMFSIATIAPRPGSDHSDHLFRDMWRWTHEGSESASALPQPASSALDDVTLRLPTQRTLGLSAVAVGDNDGVATTQRQVLGELIGVVIGDHVDVLGRYRRTSLIDDKVIDPGLLTSGAEFGDNQFFELLLRVAHNIARMIERQA